MYLGRAPRTKETLPDFRERCRVARHSRVFRELMGSQRTPRFWGITVFLHGDLAEEVYMEQPPGFVAQGESGLVYKLRRSLYGMKQSPRAWFNRFSSVVQEFGMIRNTANHSVFYHHTSTGQCIYLIVNVYDIVIIGSDHDGIQKLKQHLFSHFQTKDLGKLKYFLSI